MSRFNTKRISAVAKTVTTNRAGGKAYKGTDKLRFISLLLTSFFNDQFYRTSEEAKQELKELVQGLDSKFVAKTAIYARNIFGMRSITHAVAGELAKKVKGEKWTKFFYRDVVHRVDDITEIISYYLAEYGEKRKNKIRPIPNSLKKGLGLALQKFSGFQIAKYKGATKDLSLVDTFNLIHPKPKNEEMTEVYKKLMTGNLASTGTWESEISESGKQENAEEAKKEAWASLVKEKRISYFALLRNLRSILEQAPEVIEDACQMLINEEAIKKSLVMPFRFTTAIKAVNGEGESRLGWGRIQEKMKNIDSSLKRKAISAIDEALEISLNNVPKLEGKTVIAIDTSGSMSRKPSEIATMFGAVLAKKNNADIVLFDDDAHYLDINLRDSISTIIKNIPFHGGGTNFSSIFQCIKDKKYDRIIILSDMSSWMETSFGLFGMSTNTAVQEYFKQYKAHYGVDTLLYSWDLNGYGTLQFPEKNVICLSGFSDKVFDFMKIAEEDRYIMINTIESVPLENTI